MANQPSLIPSAWAANNSTTETIPATTTESGKASWDQGFPVETSLPLSEGGIPPKYGDFNGILNVLSQFCLFAQAGGQFTWNNTLAYSVGSIVVGSDGSIYRAVQATTNVNPVGDTSGKWERIVSQSDIMALETDIQTAMTNAANAVANASAAQSAVSTLDANVVKLSGNQTVGGTKTFTSSLVISATASLKRNVDNSYFNIYGGTAYANGAFISLHGKDDTDAGKFIVRASDGINNKDLTGLPDGTLTWAGKDIITNGGDQTIAGTKTFSTTPVLSYSGDNTILALRMDVTKGTNPSAQKTVTVCGFEKSGNLYLANRLTAWSGYVTTAGDTYSCLVAYKNASGSTATIFNTVYAKASNLSYHTTATIRPNTDNTYSCGTASYKWTQVYAASATINTSDERLKASISAVPDAVLDAWGDVNWQQFQFKDALAEKGAEKARIHNGLIAQHIDAVFKAHGLDASRYGLFCHDEWGETAEVKGEDGLVLQPYQAAGDMYSLRYEEALCMEAAYQRCRADRAEARITALERRLNEMEAAISSLISPVGDETYAEPEQEQDAEKEGEE